jgi:energy-coupling factor transporter ATP-binding protein EcfA2
VFFNTPLIINFDILLELRSKMTSENGKELSENITEEFFINPKQNQNNKTSPSVDLKLNGKSSNPDSSADSVLNSYQKEKASLSNIGDPITLTNKLDKVGYECMPYLAFQLSLLLNTAPDSSRIRSVLLEGPSGCGKSYLAKSLAKLTSSELLVLSCYRGMETRNLLEAPSSFALASAMAGRLSDDSESIMNLGILARAFLTSRSHPVILLVDEIDKPDSAIDTFFLGPIQDGVIWLESRPPIEAISENLLIIFTKNLARVLDDALLRRVHPIKMTYLDSSLEKKILSSHCHPQLIDNLVSVADIMRASEGSYQFDRPPAPEELLTAGKYIMLLLKWGMLDFGFVAAAVWNIIAKSEHDRAVLEHMLRFHPDFMDPLIPDSKRASLEEIQARLGRVLLRGIVKDSLEEHRIKAWESA